MIELISEENIANINKVSSDILVLLKEKKFFFTSEHKSADRIKGTCEFFYLNDVFKGSRFTNIETACSTDLASLKSLANDLLVLLGEQRKFTVAKIKDYAADIKPKLCRELISDLEDLYILGQISMGDIEDVYHTLNKPLPKKYKKSEMSDAANVIYAAIRQAIKEDAERIRVNSIAHYCDMVKRIDPNDDFKSPKEFFIEGRKKLSDIGTLRLCLACKFDNDLFQTLIDENFIDCVNYAANKVAEYYHGDDLPNVNVISTAVGGKGFDVRLNLDGRSMYVRAIPVEGCYVRFHYRYIIT